MADSDILSTPISKLSLTNTPPVQQDGLPSLETRSNKQALEHPSYEDLIKDAKVANEVAPVANTSGSYNEQLLDLQSVQEHHQTHQPSYTYSMAPIPSFPQHHQQEPSHMPMGVNTAYLPTPGDVKLSTSQAIRASLWNHRNTIAVCVLFLVVLAFGVPKMLQYLPKFSNSGTLQPKLTTKGMVLLSCISGGLYYSLDSFVLD
jgi:hypothetical protein